MKRFIILLMTVCLLAVAFSAVAATTYSTDDESYIRYEEAYIGKTAESSVALRSSAYSRGQIVDTLRKGVKLYVNGAKYDSDGVLWYEVETTSRKNGWVLADAVTFEEQSASAGYGGLLDGLLGGGAALGLSGSYIGNVNTHVYHLPTCHVLPNQENWTYFDSRRQAEAAGYRACGICKP